MTDTWFVWARADGEDGAEVRAFGPFATRDDARDWGFEHADAHDLIDEEWWLVGETPYRIVSGYVQLPIVAPIDYAAAHAAESVQDTANLVDPAPWDPTQTLIGGGLVSVALWAAVLASIP